MTANQLCQALRTYTTHRSFWWMTVCWLIMRVAFVSIRMNNATLLMVEILNVALGAEIGGRLISQFANSRARLLPRFAAAHLLVAGVMVAMAVAVDGWLAWNDGLSGWALVSVSVVMLAVGMASGLNLACMMLWMATIVAGAIMMFLMPPDTISDLIFGSGAAVWATLGCLALAALAAIVVRLLTLSEETAGLLVRMNDGSSTWDFTSPATHRRNWRLAAQADRRVRNYRWMGDVVFDFVMRRLGATNSGATGVSPVALHGQDVPEVSSKPRGHGRVFLDQIHQVLRTYTARWYCWVFVAFWALVVFSPLLWRGFWPDVSISEQLRDIVILPVYANVMLGMILGLKARSQFANPRSRLLPGFAAAHLTVAGVIIGLAIAIEAMLIPGWGGPIAQLGLVGLLFLAMVVAAWSCYLMHVNAMWLPFVLIMAIGYVPRQYGEGLIQALSDSLFLSSLLVCVGLAGLVALGVRLWRLSEEMPEYSRPGLDLHQDVAFRAAKQDRRWEAQSTTRPRYQAWLQDVLSGLVLRGPATLSPWRRLLLRQLTSGFCSLLWAPVQMGIVVFYFWFQDWLSIPLAPTGASMLFCVPLLMALGMWGSMWRMRWVYLARESLLPLTRQDFVRDLARSGACDMAVVAVGQCAGVVVGLALFCPDGPLVGLLPLWLALTVGQFFVAYGAMFWLVSFREFWIVFPGSLAIVGLLTGLSIAAFSTDQGFWTPLTIMPVVFAVAILVVLLYRTAFWRWCQVDLD